MSVALGELRASPSRRPWPTMPEAERTVIVMAYAEDLSQSEIAERLGWPLGTVKTRTRRALAHLRGGVRATTSARNSPLSGTPCRHRRASPTIRPSADDAKRRKQTTRPMDHDQVREQLELAAAEPGGLERLMAGDTAAARAVAAHLAGCPVVRRPSWSAWSAPSRCCATSCGPRRPRTCASGRSPSWRPTACCAARTRRRSRSPLRGCTSWIPSR